MSDDPGNSDSDLRRPRQLSYRAKADDRAAGRTRDIETRGYVLGVFVGLIVSTGGIGGSVIPIIMWYWGSTNGAWGLRALVISSAIVLLVAFAVRRCNPFFAGFSAASFLVVCLIAIMGGLCYFGG